MQLVWLTAEEACAAWHDIAPLFARVVKKAVHGEYDVDDLRHMTARGGIHVGVARENGKIVMALAFEFRHYPKCLGVNVLAMGGSRLTAFMAQFLSPFKAFCLSAGADFIECSVSPAMERLHRRSGFETVYRNMRLSVKGEDDVDSQSI
ncbi:MAG: hypothetical protein LBK01_06825 [Burkholderiaceae bacterium]|nr:hypothetical protein [Burkholderiaceae bacterium]